MVQDQNQSRISVRCDACLKAHRKCNRNYPICNNCEERDIECIYSAKSKYKKKLFEFEDKVSIFNINNKKEESKKEKRRYTKKNNQVQINLSPSENIVGYSIVYFVQQHSHKPGFENLMSILQYPSQAEANINLELFLQLADSLKVFTYKQLKSIISNKSTLLISQSYNSILNEAYELFFKFNNNVIPLFIKNQFNFNSKSTILKAAILASGLMWMEATDTTRDLIKYFEVKLFTYLHIAYKIQPTLENLQTITIVLTSLIALNWDVKLIAQLVCQANIMASILGLHTYCNKLSNLINNERALCYSALSYIHLSCSVLAVSHLPSIFQQSCLSSLYNKVMNYNPSPYFISKQIGSNIKSNCIIILSRFYNEISSLLFSLRILRSQHIQNRGKQALNGPTNKLSKQNKQIMNQYIKTYILLETRYTAKEDLDYIDSYKKYILFIHHHCNYFANSLEFYNSSYSLSSSIKNKDKLINIFIECQKIIDLACDLPPYFMLTLGLGYISQSIVFMLRYNNMTNGFFNPTILKGIDHLNYLAKLHYFKGLATSYLNIVNKLQKQMG